MVADLASVVIQEAQEDDLLARQMHLGSANPDLVVFHG
jgi:hypothetical protein